MKITPNHMISPHLEAKRRGCNCCTVGNLPKKEVVYPKREIGIDRPHITGEVVIMAKCQLLSILQSSPHEPIL